MQASYGVFPIPLSDECSIAWRKGIYDIKNREQWRVGRKDPVTQVSMIWRHVFYFIDVLKVIGELQDAYLLLRCLPEHDNPGVDLNACLRKADILHLVYRWKCQMAPYFSGNRWLDIDRYSSELDDLSFLMRAAEDHRVERLYQASLVMAPTSIACDGLADLYILRGDIKQANSYFERSLEIDKNSVVSSERAKFTRMLLENGSDHGKFMVCAKTSVREDNPGVDCIQDPVAIDHAYSYSLYVSGERSRVSISVRHPGTGIYRVRNFTECGGGKLVHNEAARCSLWNETNQLGDLHAKIYSPCILFESRDKILLERPSADSVISDEVFYISGPGWNYYHWLLEYMWGIISYNEHYKAELPLFISHRLLPWQLEFMSILGVDTRSVIQGDGSSRFRFEKAIVPMPLSTYLVPNPDVVRKIRAVLSKHKESPKPGKRIYLARNVVHGRKILNECAIRKVLDQFGFEFVDPSFMSPSEQIEFFSDAEVLVAPGGAALSNMVFCPKNVKVIMLSARRTWGETFTAIAAAIGQEAHVILGNGRMTPNPYYVWTVFDPVLSADELKKCLLAVM